MNISPELADLIEERRRLDDEMIRAITIADEFEFAVKRGEASALAHKAELKQLRDAQEAAEVAADQAMRAIARFPSRNVADAAAKMRIIAIEIEGIKLGPGAPVDPAETVNIAFARGVALDLNRLAAS